MDINICNLPVCYLQGFFLSFFLEMSKISTYCPFNGYQYLQPTRVLLPRFSFLSFSLEMSKISTYCPFNGYQYFQPTRVLFVTSKVVFICLSLWKAPLNMEHPPPLPSIQGTIQHLHAKPFQHSNKNPFVNLTSLGGGKHDDDDDPVGHPQLHACLPSSMLQPSN